jgi:xylulokinase
MPGERWILTVDLGTTGPKVGLVSTQGELLAWEKEPTRLSLLPDGGAEQDPHEWWEAIRRATHRLLEGIPEARDRIVAIGCTGMWSTLVPVDREGAPLTPAILWMDARGAPEVEEMFGGFPSVAGYRLDRLILWIRLTGGIPGHSGKDSFAHLLYLRRRRPEVYRETWKFLEAKDYLNLRLTGCAAASYDSIALFWLTDNRDIHRIDYHPALLRAAGVDREKLPDLRKAVEILGPLRPEAARDLDLRPGIPVIVGTPDVQAGAVGSGAVADEAPHLYLGTSSWLTCHVPFRRVDLLRNMTTLPSAIPGRYFIANEQETAGACLQVLGRLLQDPTATAPLPEPLLDALAAQAPPGSGGLLFAPWLYGERTPVEDSALRGGFFNLSLEARREHLVRAVFEGVAYNTRWLLEAVEGFLRHRVDHIRFIGGGARSAIWGQIMADVLNRTIHTVQEPQLAALRGVALLAAVALGELTWAEIPERVPIAATFRPDPANRARYDALFREFLAFYRATRGIYRRLHRRRSLFV